MRAWLVIAVVLLSCNRERVASTPASGSATVAAYPAPPAGAQAPAAVDTPPTVERPVGWWRSDALCLELFANGDFELNIMPPGQHKQQVLGSAKLTKDGDAWKVELSVARIWQARFIGPCRKIVENADFVPTAEALGVRFEPKATATLTLRTTADGASLCAGEQCATLKRETPRLVGFWNLAGDGSIADLHPRKGDLVGIDLAEPGYAYMSQLLVGGNGQVEWINARGDADGVATYTAPDHFTILIAKRHLTATRLPQERIELCESTTCVQLDRRFDRDSSELR